LFEFPESFYVNTDVKNGEFLFIELEDFASEVGVVNQKVFTFFLTGQIDSSNEGVIVRYWVYVNLQDFRIDLSKGLNQLLFKLFVTLLLITFIQSLSNQREIRVVFFVVEKQSNLRVGLIKNSNSDFLIDFVGLFSIFEFK